MSHFHDCVSFYLNRNNGINNTLTRTVHPTSATNACRRSQAGNCHWHWIKRIKQTLTWVTKLLLHRSHGHASYTWTSCNIAINSEIYFSIETCDVFMKYFWWKTNFIAKHMWHIVIPEVSSWLHARIYRSFSNHQCEYCI